MNKGLEALKIIENYQVIIDCEKDETSTIKEQLPNSCNIIEKELKALEIIKESQILLIDEDEMRLKGVGGVFITQEEFDLLKEVLL